jgi:hypothetical protein
MNVDHLLLIEEESSLSEETFSNLYKNKSSRVISSASKLYASFKKEKIILLGEKKEARRIFINTPKSGNYASLGWLLKVDIPVCMICSDELFSMGDKIHCRACGIGIFPF